jgi:hypothetical protein
MSRKPARTVGISGGILIYDHKSIAWKAGVEMRYRRLGG